MCHKTVLDKCYQGECETGRGDGGEIEWKLSVVNTRDVSRGQNELIGEFKMVPGDVISIRGLVMRYMYIPTGIKREFVRFGMDCNQKG